MSLKPIDLQVSINQLPEVGRNEQARNGAIAEQQHLRDTESHDKSRNAQNRVDETQKGSQEKIGDREKRHGSRQGHDSEPHGDKEKKPSGERITDDRMGRIIDVLK